MKPATVAPAYVGLYPFLCEVARAHGYALAVHGSVVNDFDLIAAPWVDNASSVEELIRALVEQVSESTGYSIRMKETLDYASTDKPHGRRSFSIPIDCGSRIDISVMPLGGTPQ